MSLADFVEWFIFPPGGVILLVLLGLLLWRWRVGRLFALLGVLVLWAASTPILSNQLTLRLQWQPALSQDALWHSRAQAIVVLAGGRKLDTPDWGDTVGEWTLVRLRYAAHLQRLSGLPIVTSGGAVEPVGKPEAELMARVLREEFGAEVRFAERASHDTEQNARFTYTLLEPRGIRRVVLVTHALHMRRAKAAFERAGFEVVAAPTDYVRPSSGLYAWSPHARTLYQSWLALHELVGGWWYQWRH
jgi:uncharacterized SAM-binding protein YcdF (DUF218 family)